jgi:hypothetical protein
MNYPDSRCARCRDLTIADLRGTDFLHQPSFLMLKISAKSGCDLCNLFYTGITTDLHNIGTKSKKRLSKTFPMVAILDSQIVVIPGYIWNGWAMMR